MPSLDVVIDPVLHVAVDTLRVLNSVGKHSIELFFILAVARSVIQHARVLRGRHFFEEGVKLVSVDRSEEDDVQH